MTKTVVHGKVKWIKSISKKEWIADMKIIKKSMAVLAAVILMTGLASCDDMKLREAKPVTQGVLRVGMNLDIPSMCYLSEETSNPEGFEVEVAQKLADKLNMELEIVDTSEKNLLKSLDADLYDCVISAVGISDWNDTHYEHTTPYADISSVSDRTGITSKYTKIAVFTKKYNLMKDELEAKLQMMRNDGSLKELSEKYFEKDIIISE